MGQVDVATTLGENLNGWFATVDKLHLAIALAILIVVYFLRKGVTSWVIRVAAYLLNSIGFETPDAATPAFRRSVQAFLIALTFLNIASSLNLDEVTNGIVFKVFGTILLLAVFSVIFRLSEYYLLQLVSKENNSSLSGHDWLLGMARLMIVVCSIVAVLAYWGLDINGAVTGVGVLGAGLAIAAQDMIKNLIAGVSNREEKRFKVGDWIEIPSQVSGTVEYVGFRSTRVMSIERVPVNVPNSILSNSLLWNNSLRDHWRIVLDIPVSWLASEQQISLIAASITRHIEQSGDFVTDGSLSNYVRVVGVEEDAIQIRIQAFCNSNSFSDFLDAKERITTTAVAAVAAADTELAYPLKRLARSIK